MPQPRELTSQQALAKLQDMCARAEHCEGEVRERLRRWGIAPAVADKIVERLRADRYVDDTRFANAFVRDKVMFAHWGFIKIRQALMQKHVDRDIAAAAIDAFDADEYQSTLEHIIAAKLKAKPELADTFEGRTKLYRFLLSRGFEAALAAATLKRVISEK